jgi:TolB protein
MVISIAGASDIYTVCPDGNDLTNLTNDSYQDGYPAWSPDGSKIAYVSSRAGMSQIYIILEDGSSPRQLTSDHSNDHPIWLSDGKQIAFRTTDQNGLWWWRILDLKKGAVSNYSSPSYDFFFQTPAWSPDGHAIAYMSLVEQEQRNDGSSQIHVKDINDFSDTALTADVWANINPIWSPDGERIAFLSERDGIYNLFALYVMNKDGTMVRKLSEPVYPETTLFSWSPNGEQIAIDADAAVGKITLVDVNTGEARLLLLPHGDQASQPAWQP